MSVNIKNNETGVFAVGGLDEIGKNTYGVQFQDEIILIDAGIRFPEDDLLGIDYVIPDYTYLKENEDKIKGLFITHGHQDHIGGIPYLLKEINVPIYADAFAMSLIESSLREHHLLKDTELHTIAEDEVIKFRKTSVSFFRVTHSIPEAFGVVVQTPSGNIVHTGDFKFDFTPVGKQANLHKMAKIGSDGALALLSDSTNAEVEEFTKSERVVGDTIARLVNQIDGRIIFATFASNISRVQMLIDAAVKTGRKISVFGRSMVNAVENGQELGYLTAPDGLFVKANELNNLPDNESIVLCTGSQGERLAALSRIANGTHQQLSVQPNDTVIFSSSPIPGNKNSVKRVINQLRESGATVIHGKLNNIHTSGHGSREEQKLMLSLIKPKFFVPIHGEHRMLRLHANMAQDIGVPEENCFVMDNGDVLALTADTARLAGHFDAEEVYVDGKGIGDIGNIVLRDRRILSDNGLLVVVVTIDLDKRRIESGPDIISRGFIYMRESEDLIRETQKVAFNSVQKSLKFDTVNKHKMKSSLIDSLKNFLYKRTERKPMILPVFMEI